MINKLSILFLLGATALSAQNNRNVIKATHVGDSVRIAQLETPDSILEYEIYLQNNDMLTQSVRHFSETGSGTWFLPYCNTLVSCQAVRYDFASIGSNVDTIIRSEVTANAWSLPRKRITVEVNTDFTIQILYIGDLKPTMFYSNSGMGQHYPSAHFQAGQHTLFLPYARHGLNVVRITATRPGCPFVVGRFIYLN